MEDLEEKVAKIFYTTISIAALLGVLTFTGVMNS